MPRSFADSPTNQAFVEFAPFDEVGDRFVLTRDSADSLNARIHDPSTINFGGTKVHGTGWFMADHLPEGLEGDNLHAISHDLAVQIGCEPVAASINTEYERRMKGTQNERISA